MNSKFFIIILSLFFLVSCGWFERQDHEITKPVIPTYKVYGHTLKISDGNGIAGLELLLQQELTFDGGWTDQKITYTDKDGYFEFEDVPRGKYILYIYYDNDILLYTFVFSVINYDDMELEIAIPL